MARGLLLRLGWSAGTLLGTSVVVFLITHAVPADPIAAYAGPHADRETRDRIRRQLGLDDPLPAQYVRYLGRALAGDLGESYVTREPVHEAIRSRFPITLAVAGGGLFFWLLVGVPVGLLTARWRGRPIDHAVLLLAMIGISLPTFWLGRMLQFQLAYRGGAFPVAGSASAAHFLLPCLTLGLVGVGYYARLVHSSMVEVLNQEFVRAARAKGRSEAGVLWRHALPNALLPILTVIGLDAATLLGGVVFTENVFALPGIGSLALQAVLTLDVPMIMGTVLYAAVFVVGANLMVDLLYRVVDPRIRGGAERGEE